MAKVRIPTPLRSFTQGRDEVAITGQTIGDVLKNLEKEFQGIGDKILDEKGNIRRFRLQNPTAYARFPRAISVASFIAGVLSNGGWPDAARCGFLQPRHSTGLRLHGTHTLQGWVSTIQHRK